ncbi:MAG: PAS domain S-box protein [Promethearchaeota archaeon]
MLEETILDLIIAIYTCIAAFVVAYAFIKKRSLLPWMIGSAQFAVGAIFLYLQDLNSIYRLIGNLFYLITVLIFISAVSYEYYTLFLKHKLIDRTNFSILVLLLSSATIVLISVQIVIMILLLLSIGMLLRIYVKKRNIIYAFMILTLTSAILTNIATILNFYEITGSWELSYVGNFATVSFLLTTGLAAPIETKLEESEKKYRDLFNNATSGIAYHELMFNNDGTPIDYKITDVNPQYERILSLKKQDVINKLATMVYQVESAPYLDIYSKVAETLEPNSFETYYSPLDKHFRISVISSKKNNFITVFDDITEQKLSKQKLKETESTFQNIIENITDIIIVTGYNRENIYTSPQVTKKLGWTNILQNPLFEIIYPDDRKKLIKMYEESIRKREVLNKNEIEIRLRNTKGEYIWFAGTTNDYYDELGQKVGYITSLRDIDKRKQTEQLLKESEEKYKRIIENTTDVIVVTNFKGKHIYISPQYFNLLGYSEEEAGRIMFELIHPDDRERMIQYYKESIGEKKDLKLGEIEQRWRHKDGHYIWVSTITKNYNNEKGEMIGWITSIRSISERKLAEQKLKDSEQKYRSLFDGANDAIFVTEGEKIIDANIMAVNIFGYEDISEFIGLTPWDISPLNQPDGKNSRKQGLKLGQKALDGEPQRLYWQHKKKDGALIDTEISMSKILIEEKSYIQAIIRDITEKMEAERLILEENKKLLELHETRKDLITRISHELKTPLTSLYGVVQTLLFRETDKLNDDLLYFLNIAHHGAVRLKELIDNLLDVSRLESKKLILVKKEESIVKIIEDCVAEMTYMANQRGISLNTSLPEILTFYVDKFRLEQAITNIISNAIKNTPHGGKVDISLKEQNNSIEISVVDNGVGITENEMKKIFEKFGKIERYGMGLDVDIEGSGLGLFISKEIIDLHGGQILIESEGRNKGTKAKIQLNK